MSNWFPRTEELQRDEMRIIFIGTSPTIHPGQMNTSICVQLGNGSLRKRNSNDPEEPRGKD